MNKAVNKIIGGLFALVFSLQASAGFIIETDKTEYNIGDDILLSVYYATDDNSPIADILDVEFSSLMEFRFSDSIANFPLLSLSSAYDNIDVIYDALLIDYSFGEGDVSLITLGFDAPFSLTDTKVELTTLSFTSINSGLFTFDLAYADLFGDIPVNEGGLGFEALYDEFFDEPITHSVNVVNNSVSVPEPNSLFILASALALLVNRRKKL